MNYIKQNISYLRNSKGLSQGEFGKLFDCSRDNIASYERGTEPKIDFIQKIVNYFHIDINQFINMNLAEPEKDQEEKRSHSIAEEPVSVHSTSGKKHSMQKIPLYDIEAAAGLVSVFDNKQNIIDFISIPNLPKCDGALPITGDSMYPLLKSGDIVMYKRLQDITHGILYGEMYLLSLAIDDEEMITVKFVQKSELGLDHIKLVSQNSHHSPKDVPMKMIRAMALVKASIRINTMM